MRVQPHREVHRVRCAVMHRVGGVRPAGWDVEHRARRQHLRRDGRGGTRHSLRHSLRHPQQTQQARHSLHSLHSPHPRHSLRPRHSLHLLLTLYFLHIPRRLRVRRAPYLLCTYYARTASTSGTPSSERGKASRPLPRASGSAAGLSAGAGGAKTRQCFDPTVCRTKTSYI